MFLLMCFCVVCVFYFCWNVLCKLQDIYKRQEERESLQTVLEVGERKENQLWGVGLGKFRL